MTTVSTWRASVMARRVLEGAAEERQHAAPVHDAHPAEQRREGDELRERPRRRSGLQCPALVEEEVERIEAGRDDEAELAVPRVALDVLSVRGREEQHPGDRVEAEADDRPWQQPIERPEG